MIIIWFNSSFNAMKCPLIIFMLCILYSVEWTHHSSFGTKLHCINYISDYIHFTLPFPVCSHPSLSVFHIRVSCGWLLIQNSSGWEWSFPLEPFYRHSFPFLWQIGIMKFYSSHRRECLEVIFLFIRSKHRQFAFRTEHLPMMNGVLLRGESSFREQMSEHEFSILYLFLVFIEIIIGNISFSFRIQNCILIQPLDFLHAATNQFYFSSCVFLTLLHACTSHVCICSSSNIITCIY